MARSPQKRQEKPTSDTTDLVRISKAAQLAGVSKQVVEYYILLGMIEPIRPENGRARFFDESLIRRIQLIRRLNGQGYTLQAIRETYLKDK
jgi:DNA-binding transcriptional MerR regulator